MSETAIDSLFERIQLTVRPPEGHREVLIPIAESSIFFMLANEVVRLAGQVAGEDLLLLIDAQTAGHVDAFDRATAVARNAVVFGQPLAHWSASPRVAVIPDCESITREDRFVVALSEEVNLAVVCRQVENARGQAVIEGGWSGLRPCVSAIAGIVHNAAGAAFELPPSTREGAGESAQNASQVTHLMALVADQLTSHQRDIAMDKDDLFCVLNILKAISAKRRAHDILYVFVDQVARVIGIDRCSVVRVWGGDSVGHVLASHEDESVRDVAIDLSKYPELLRSMETREKVVVNDACLDPLTRRHADHLRQAGIRSLIVIPIVLFDQQVGSLLLRAARRHGGFNLREVSFFEIVAEAAANALERAHLFESIQKANERLEHLAVTDGLTGLYNHRFFRERLEEEFQRARRYDLPLSCLIMDVDDFKRVNDNFGHLEGDSVLKELAERTQRSVRTSDIVARYGGEELVVIMPQTGLVGAQSQGERLRRAVEETIFRGLPDTCRVTISVGLAVYNRETMLDCESIIRTADSALYEAKRSGKNRVIVSTNQGDQG